MRNPLPRRSLRAIAPVLASLVLLILLALPIPPASGDHGPHPLPRELRGALASLDDVSASHGYVTHSEHIAYNGRPAVYAVYEGGGVNGFARAIAHVDWQVGQEVVYAASFLLPRGFHDRIQGQVDIMRWDNWPRHKRDADWGGISIWEGDRMARLLRFGARQPEVDVIGEPFQLPEGRWFRLEVRQHLTPNSGAVSSVRTDGEVVSWAFSPTTYGRPIERIRFGLVAIADGAQELPLELFLADPEAQVMRSRRPPRHSALDGLVAALRPLFPDRWLTQILENIR